MFHYLNIFTKTIPHEESKKSQYAQWLHPDVVGVYFPVEEWEDVVLDLSNEIGQTGIKLFSYEIKKELTYDNLRESYFQAVSNSSWANEGYLVAASIQDDENFIQELKRLTTAFGIGIIRLDTEYSDSTEILFQARIKKHLDIETINKLSQLNSTFRQFLKRIIKDKSTKEIRKDFMTRLLNQKHNWIYS